MSNIPENMRNLYKPCVNQHCDENVHIRAKACKKCGAQSPFEVEEVLQTAKPKNYVVERDFSCMIGVSFRAFTEGEVLNDPALIAKLIEEECPIRIKLADDQMILCPHCKRTFLAEPDAQDPHFTPDTAEKIRRLGLM